MGNFNGWDIEICGSDINQRVLQVARKGYTGKIRSGLPNRIIYEILYGREGAPSDQ
jgi:chemotaxis methyl-accepting protein methylase